VHLVRLVWYVFFVYRTFLKHATDVVYMLESRHVSVILLGKKIFSIIDHFARCKEHWSRSTSCF